MFVKEKNEIVPATVETRSAYIVTVFNFFSSLTKIFLRNKFGICMVNDKKTGGEIELQTWSFYVAFDIA